MNSAKPPRLAAWILQHFGPEFNQEALSGDLNEAFQQGRSKGWYWRQVLAAIGWRRLMRSLLGSAAVAWITTSPFDGPAPTLVSRPIDLTVLTTVYFASILAPGIKRRKLRIVLGLLIAAAFGLLWFYRPNPISYWSFLLLAAWEFVIERKARRRAFTVRELVYGDPEAERQRLLEKLHFAMLQETDPEKRYAYMESIAALRKHLLPGTKVVE